MTAMEVENWQQMDGELTPTTQLEQKWRQQNTAAECRAKQQISMPRDVVFKIKIYILFFKKFDIVLQKIGRYVEMRGESCQCIFGERY